MNTGLKVLGGVTLIMVILLCGITIWQQLDKSKKVSTSTEAVIKEDPTGPVTKPESNTSEPIIVVKDDPLQSKYRPINQPSFMQEIRKPGKTYISRVAGTVRGRGSNSDWGIKGDAYFIYIYGFQSEAKVLSNDGLEIVEERKFSNVVDKIMVSDISIGFDFSDRLKFLLDFLGSSAAGSPCPVGTVLDGKSVNIKDSWIGGARKLGFFKKFPQMDPKNISKKFKMLSKKDGKLLLAGKTVRITYTDGHGVAKIEPINCELSKREIEIIKRTNYLMDHYVFPDRKVQPGDEWNVDGSTFAGLIDPEMSGKVGGEVEIIRQPDFPQEDGEYTKRLKIKGGTIVVRDNKAGNVITGELTGLSGRLIIPDKENVVTKALMKGYADYKKVSTNHLLFGAKMSVKPVFEVRYDCEVIDSK